ncbi:ESX secretion-associated protein EspG [Actinophytocola gossypii]|uniref:ESX secretion-associated protein EspG n=1 Tax=Actinophytocola gossypii TaxID=2812003 RepID=A0ABT2JIX2_9PSEU|nr:ESX secretion-associated protein EspG [Actinophytocola gossypii]MCT2587825.1 ESX secretion-associated protein EspG [Actinophytocola gossypii]
MGERITLSSLEYDVLWEHLELGPFRPVIAVRTPGATRAERAELRDKAWSSLAGRGLGRRHAVDERLAHLLGRLARPERELDVRFRLRSPARRSAALIGRAGRGATVAVLVEDTLELWNVRPDQVVGEAVRLLPAHPAGTGGSITLPAATLDRAAAKAGADADRFARALSRQGLGRSEARKLAEVLGGVVGLGHFGAASTAGGERRRATHVVSVYDSHAGRYLFTRKNEWVTLLPGTEQAVARQLDELLDEVDRA